jgi:hypothetical protein
MCLIAVLHYNLAILADEAAFFLITQEGPHRSCERFEWWSEW